MNEDKTPFYELSYQDKFKIFLDLMESPIIGGVHKLILPEQLLAVLAKWLDDEDEKSMDEVHDSIEVTCKKWADEWVEGSQIKF